MFKTAGVVFAVFMLMAATSPAPAQLQEPPNSTSIVQARALKPFRLDFGALSDDPDPEPPASTGGWDLRVAPYLWAPSLDGTLSGGGTSVDVDTNFPGYLDNVDFAFFGRLEAKKDRWHLGLEGVYLQSGDGETVNRTLDSALDLSSIIGGIDLRPPNVPPPGALPPRIEDIVNDLADLIAAGVSARLAAIEAILGTAPHPSIDSIDYDVDVVMLEFSGGYRVADWDCDNGQSLHLDVLGGARYWDVAIETTLSITPGLLELLPSSVTLNGDESWLDPIVGGRVRWDVSDRLTFGVRGDIGGFGVGSDFSWNVLGVVEYEFAPNVALIAGYRALAVDYTEGAGADAFEFDVTLHGPILGLAIRF